MVEVLNLPFKTLTQSWKRQMGEETDTDLMKLQETPSL